MKKGILAIITTLIFIGAHGQDLDWMIKSGKVNVPNNNIAVDANGNVYMVADALDTIDVDPSSNVEIVPVSASGGQETFLVKYDSQGNFLWVRIMNSSIQSSVSNFSVDDDGNCYVSGQFDGDIDFDNSITTDNLTDSNLQGPTGFLAKYDNNGNFLWSKVANGKVNATSNSEFLLYGFYNSSTDFDLGNGTHFEPVFDSIGGVYVAKYDGTSNLISVKTTSDGEQKHIVWAGEKNGEIYLAVHESELDTVLINTDTYIFSTANFFISKYNINGNLDWKRTVGQNGDDRVTSCVLDNLGNLYVAGNFQNTVNFNPAGVSNNLVSVGRNDMFIAKYNSTGINEWAYNISDQLDTSTAMFYTIANQILSMDYGINEGLLISGTHSQELEVNHSGGMTLLTPINGAGSFVMNFDENGIYNWGETIQSASNGYVHGHGIATNNNGNFYWSGHFESEVDFDLGTGVHSVFAPFKALFLAKYSFNTVGIHENEFNLEFSLYPNPASKNISIELEIENQLVNIQIISRTLRII